ncbi:phospholipid carrier-dependent glycosyltransferase [Paraglaciecola sp. Hal342]
MLLFSFQFVLQAKTAQIDAMVGSWIMIGCYGFLRLSLVERQWRWYYLALFFMGIGVITKGRFFACFYYYYLIFYISAFGLNRKR